MYLTMSSLCFYHFAVTAEKTRATEEHCFGVCDVPHMHDLSCTFNKQEDNQETEA